MKKRRLTKSRTDKIFFGVLGGIANYLDVDPVLVRAIFIFLFMMFDETMAILYFSGALIIPKAPKHFEHKIASSSLSSKNDEKEPSVETTEEDWSDF